ncbi:hypothetical protein ABMA27_000834 [Loxostege sticticalis]|uniref:Integrase catalytic domain-containing protein n=1 Tax=Loxostege sticticalis TaxID=481309 RepID=A0ABR3I0I4_LOXSC
MFFTPPKMVNTRSMTRRELDQNDDQSQPQENVQVQVTDSSANTIGNNMMSARAETERMSKTSSLMARKKRLELETAKRKAEIEMRKARIEMELLDKQLEADVAELEDEECTASHFNVHTSHFVDQWLEESSQTVEKTQPAHDKGKPPGELCPPAPQFGSPAPVVSADTVHMLATALKDLASTSAAKAPNNTYMNRLCMPRSLPDFHGDPMEWLPFREAYNESSEVCNFTPKENLWRLRTCLHGAAKEAVSALLISASSPDTIMSTLELKFGNPDLIISRVLLDIKKLQPLPNDYQKYIVPFSVKVQNLIEAIRCLKREEYLQGMNIVSNILTKLPTVLISKWSDYSFPLISEGKMPRLLMLSDFLKAEALKISTTSNTYFEESRFDQTKSYQRNKSANLPHHAVLLQSEQKDATKCQFCRTSNHSLVDCKRFRKALRTTRWQHVKRNGLCFKCISSRHNKETCTAPVCDIDNCGQAHHKLLHYPITKRDASIEQSTISTVQSTSHQDASTETVTHINSTDRRVLLKVVPVHIHGPNEIISTSALLDDGSTVSLISGALAERAGLRGRRETMRVSGACTDSELVLDSTVVSVNISGMDNKLHSIRARSISELNLPIQRMINVNEYLNLSDIQSNLCTTDVKPELLLGQDNYHLLFPLEVILGKPNEPSATLTPLGWCIHGDVRVPRNFHPSPHVTLFISEGGDSSSQGDRLLQDIHDDVKRSFTLDSLGVSGKPRQNADDVRAAVILENSAQLVDGRWYVGLPWRDMDCQMPDSYPNALKRLKGIERKMSKDTGYASRYEERIQHLLENDFAEELKVNSATSKTWVLPHFGVDNPNKKKLRLVFDAADRVDGYCLNDFLLTGPDLLLSLFGVMLRFRENKIAVTGDIKDMFLRVKVHPEDQQAFRFLWRSSPKEPVRTYVMTSLIFGANCSPFVAQFVKNKNAKRFESTMPAAVDAIVNSHYMDDYIDSLPDITSAIEMAKNVTDIHKSGGFEIRNWTSNSAEVLDSIPKEALGSVAVRFKIDEQLQGERILGLIWYPKEDELGFDVSLKRIPESVIQGKQKPTKRLMLRVIMSVFDVLGFLSPFTIQGRIMLQDTWRLNVGWDDLVPEDIYKKWCQWIDTLKVINQIRIPRCHLNVQASNNCEKPSSVPAATDLTSPPDGPLHNHSQMNVPQLSRQEGFNSANGKKYTNLQLHVFSDASTKAMSAVAYWRWSIGDKICVSFIASKCRVLPVKPMTVPKAELQAAVLAARLAETIGKDHRLVPEQRFFWCDSSAVIHWIRNSTRKYKIFEANRLGEIDELTRVSEWRYVPTKLNIADLATRESFNLDCFHGEWFTGPAFLYENESVWPADMEETEKEQIQSANVMVIQDNSVTLPVPDPRRFSSWLRLVRSTAVVLKFIDKCRKLTGVIDCDTMRRAECLLLKQAQNDSFSEELSALKDGKCVSRSSRLLTLCPIIDEQNLLRVGGRIDAAADVTLEMKRPIILDGRHPVARLIVRHYHVKSAHGCQETVVNELKQSYWIINVRRVRKCLPRVPRMGDLPEARLAHHQRPFTHCGLDLFGPLEVTIGRRREKRYGVLFTCLTVRAVHIELVASLSTDSLIMALRRMAARRGWPCHLYSDNGTNLRGAEKELKRCMANLDTEVLKQEGVNNHMDWHFIPPFSPHWGGAWERLIRSVKTSLKVVMTGRTPKEETLLTLLVEVENMVNSRPLSHVSVDPTSVESLTPNHFLLGTSSNLPTFGEFDDTDLHLRKQWRKAQRLADMFWNRWVREILPDMLPRKKWSEEQEPLRVGDLVLVVDPSSPRNTWPKGVIHHVYPGKDGRIRMLDVKTKTGIWRRSAARVAPIEVSV